MAVVINKSTGLAENLPDGPVDSSTHEIPLYSPEGVQGTAAPEDAAELLASGYTQPNQEQLQQLMSKAKHSTSDEAVKTGVEGAMSGITGGLSTLQERLMGVPAEDINARREANPGSHTIGELAGLGVGLLGGAPAGAVKLGEMAAAKLGAETFAGKVGSAVAKGAIENMLFTSSDEASRAFAQDPTQSAETALTNIGLSGLLGGALTGAGAGGMELWKQGPGKTLGSILSFMKNRTGGVPKELTQMAGINLSPEMEGALSEIPEAQKAFQVLQESNSSSGAKAKAAYDTFTNDIRTATSSAFGKTNEEIAALSDISDYEAGSAIKQHLDGELKRTVEPIAKAYDEFAEKFKGAEVAPEAKSDLATKIADLQTELGLNKTPSASGNKLIADVLQELPLQETAQDLRNYARNLGDKAAYGTENYYLGKRIKSLFRDVQDSTITGAAGSEGPGVIQAFQETQKQYAQMRDLLDTLNDRLHVGKYAGADSFMQNLKAMQPEDIVRRLSTKSDAELQQLLNTKFPEVAEAVRQNELAKILKGARDKTGEGLDPKKLFKKIESLQPEQRDYLIGPEVQAKLDAIHGLLQRVPQKMNPSGTAKTLDVLWDNVPASAVAMASLISGHNPIAGFLLGKVATLVGKEAPDAMRLSLLKFLASDAPVNAAALKESVQLAQHALKGEKELNKAIKNVLASKVEILMPSQSEIEKLKSAVDAASANPESLMNIGGEANHYMPDHVAGLSAAAARTVQYLTTLKPSEAAPGILDAPRKVSRQEKTQYEDALRIAENPLLVLKSIQDGSLTIKEMQHLHAMYPGLAAKMQSKLGEELINHVSDGKPIKYKTKIATAMFMGQPLNSSMTPQSIMSAQQAMLSAQRNMQPHSKAPNSKASLGKNASMYLTPDQDRIIHKNAK